MKIDFDGPTVTRAAVQFRNWTRPGLVISPDKLPTDAKNLRAAANILIGIATPESAGMARALSDMAAQWEAAMDIAYTPAKFEFSLATIADSIEVIKKKFEATDLVSPEISRQTAKLAESRKTLEEAVDKQKEK